MNQQTVQKTNRPFIIDVEASGFGQEGYPIEIGLALRDNERYCSLIAPSPGWTHWDKKAEQVHHISRDLLYLHGKELHKVALELNHLLSGITVFSDAWGVDKPWVSKLFYTAGINQEFYISPLERILNENQMNIWHETKEALIAQQQLTRHRASTDAFIIQETYVRTLAISQ